MSPVTEATALIARFIMALDDHDWPGVTACLGDTVRRDYSSLTGAPPDEIAGPDLVAEWEGALRGLDAHQHLLGPPAVQMDSSSDTARAATHVVGTHVLEGDSGSPWVVGGTYRFVLRSAGDRWRIIGLTLDTRWQTGDGALLQRAARGAGASSTDAVDAR
jgi:SnoaL-like domain